MEPQTWNAMQETLYNNLMMIIQYVTLAIVGSASLLFIIICLVGAVSDYVEGMTRSARCLLKPAPKPIESPKLDEQGMLAGKESYIQ